MLALLTILHSVFGKYLESLEKDLVKSGFNIALIVVALSLAGSLVAVWLILTGQFHMPTNPQFYTYWLGVTFIYEFTAILTFLGLLNTNFFAASGFRNVGFVITALYAALFLKETYSTIQFLAITVAAMGSLLFFKKGMSKSYFQENKGILLILFSLLLHPLGIIFYKAATLQTHSYNEFLAGRIIMDLVFYSIFLVVVYLIWYRKNPLAHLKLLFKSHKGLFFIFCSTIINLIGSWLIFKIPISLFTILSTVSIPVAYIIGVKKYQESWNWRYAFGAALIIIGVITFILPK